MNRLNLQLNNFNMIFDKLEKIYRNNDTVVDIVKYIDRDSYYITILVNYSNGKNQPFCYGVEEFEELGNAYDIYDTIRNKINYSIYKINN